MGALRANECLMENKMDVNRDYFSVKDVVLTRANIVQLFQKRADVLLERLDDARIQAIQQQLVYEGIYERTRQWEQKKWKLKTESKVVKKTKKKTTVKTDTKRVKSGRKTRKWRVASMSSEETFTPDIREDKVDISPASSTPSVVPIPTATSPQSDERLPVPVLKASAPPLVDKPEMPPLISIPKQLPNVSRPPVVTSQPRTCEPRIAASLTKNSVPQKTASPQYIYKPRIAASSPRSAQPEISAKSLYCSVQQSASSTELSVPQATSPSQHIYKPRIAASFPHSTHPEIGASSPNISKPHISGSLMDDSVPLNASSTEHSVPLRPALSQHIYKQRIAETSPHIAHPENAQPQIAASSLNNSVPLRASSTELSIPQSTASSEQVSVCQKARLPLNDSQPPSAASSHQITKPKIAASALRVPDTRIASPSSQISQPGVTATPTLFTKRKVTTLSTKTSVPQLQDDAAQLKQVASVTQIAASSSHIAEPQNAVLSPKHSSPQCSISNQRVPVPQIAVSPPTVSLSPSSASASQTSALPIVVLTRRADVQPPPSRTSQTVSSESSTVTPPVASAKSPQMASIKVEPGTVVPMRSAPTKPLVVIPVANVAAANMPAAFRMAWTGTNQSKTNATGRPPVSDPAVDLTTVRVAPAPADLQSPTDAVVPSPPPPPPASAAPVVQRAPMIRVRDPASLGIVGRRFSDENSLRDQSSANPITNGTPQTTISNEPAKVRDVPSAPNVTAMPPVDSERSLSDASTEPADFLEAASTGASPPADRPACVPVALRGPFPADGMQTPEGDLRQIEASVHYIATVMDSVWSQLLLLTQHMDKVRANTNANPLHVTAFRQRCHQLNHDLTERRPLFLATIRSLTARLTPERAFSVVATSVRQLRVTRAKAEDAFSLAQFNQVYNLITSESNRALMDQYVKVGKRSVDGVAPANPAAAAAPRVTPNVHRIARDTPNVNSYVLPVAGNGYDRNHASNTPTTSSGHSSSFASYACNLGNVTSTNGGYQVSQPTVTNGYYSNHTSNMPITNSGHSTTSASYAGNIGNVSAINSGYQVFQPIVTNGYSRNHSSNTPTTNSGHSIASSSYARNPDNVTAINGSYQVSQPTATNSYRRILVSNGNGNLGNVSVTNGGHQSNLMPINGHAYSTNSTTSSNRGDAVGVNGAHQAVQPTVTNGYHMYPVANGTGNLGTATATTSGDLRNLVSRNGVAGNPNSATYNPSRAGTVNHGSTTGHNIGVCHITTPPATNGYLGNCVVASTGNQRYASPTITVATSPGKAGSTVYVSSAAATVTYSPHDSSATVNAARGPPPLYGASGARTYGDTPRSNGQPATSSSVTVDQARGVACSRESVQNLSVKRGQGNNGVRQSHLPVTATSSSGSSNRVSASARQTHASPAIVVKPPIVDPVRSSVFVASKVLTGIAAKHTSPAAEPTAACERPRPVLSQSQEMNVDKPVASSDRHSAVLRKSHEMEIEKAVAAEVAMQSVRVHPGRKRKSAQVLEQRIEELSRKPDAGSGQRHVVIGPQGTAIVVPAKRGYYQKMDRHITAPWMKLPKGVASTGKGDRGNVVLQVGNDVAAPVVEGVGKTAGFAAAGDVAPTATVSPGQDRETVIRSNAKISTSLPPSLEVCVECGEQSVGLCGACKRVAYCSNECMTGHWVRLHNKECQLVGKVPT